MNVADFDLLDHGKPAARKDFQHRLVLRKHIRLELSDAFFPGDRDKMTQQVPGDALALKILLYGEGYFGMTLVVGCIESHIAPPRDNRFIIVFPDRDYQVDHLIEINLRGIFQICIGQVFFR